MVVTSAPFSACTSVMHESVGLPSTRTVQAPQCPSPQATFVPVSESSSRSASASVVPTGLRTSYTWSLTFTSGIGGHRLDVGEVDQAGRQPHGLALADLVLRLGERGPD